MRMPTLRQATLPSIRGRLTRWILAVSWVAGLALATTVGVLLHYALDELLDDGLQESAEVLYGLLSQNSDHIARQRGMLPAPSHEEGLVWQLVGNDGRMWLRSHRAPGTPLTPHTAAGFSNAPLWRIYSMPLPDGTALLHVAQSADHRHHAQLWTVGGSLGLSLLVGCLAVLWLKVRVSTEMQPLHNLSAVVRSFDPLRPDATLPAAARAELLPLVSALNDLADRLRARVAHERAFAAHAAHALRTPLAGIDMQLAVAQREAPASMQARLNQTREAAARLRRVTTALISLFRAGGQMNWQAVQLKALVDTLPVRGVHVSVRGEDTLWCDPDLLSAALLNLFDNAARHHASHLQVKVTGHDPIQQISVSDNGEGLSAERLAAVQHALQTGQSEDVLGLGLTLVDLVARNHGGQVSLASGAGGAGCCVTLTLSRQPRASRT